MALFLQENISKKPEIGFANLQESAAALLDLSNRRALMVEALLTADYIVDQQTRNLSEGQALDKVKAFARKAWETVKSLAKTVWAVVKRVGRLVVRKIKELFLRAKDFLTGNQTKVPKAFVEGIHTGFKIADHILFLTEKGFLHQSAESITKEYNDLIAEMRSSASAMSDKNALAEVSVSKSWMDSAARDLIKLGETMEDAADKQDRYLAELESKLANDPNVQGKIQAVRAGIEAIQVVAGFANQSAATMSQSAGVDPDGGVDLTAAKKDFNEEELEEVFQKVQKDLDQNPPAKEHKKVTPGDLRSFNRFLSHIQRDVNAGRIDEARKTFEKMQGELQADFSPEEEGYQDLVAIVKQAEAMLDGGSEGPDEAEEQFRELLSQHDWYYTYSDDNSVFRAGKASETKVKQAYRAFAKSHGEAKARQIWSEIAPQGYSAP